MSFDDIPEECLNDPQFVTVLVATMCSQNASSQKLIEDGERELKELKAEAICELEERKKLKQSIAEKKHQIALLEPTSESLTYIDDKLNEQVNEIEAHLQARQQKIDLEKRAYIEILDQYKATWENHKIEYEQMSLAIKRKEAETRLKKLQIQLIVMELKKSEVIKMLIQKRVINERITQVKIVEFSGLLLNRWKMQDYLDQQTKSIDSLLEKLQSFEQHYNLLKNEIEEKEKAKLLARQQMPPPRLDFGSFARTFYPEPTSTYQRKNFNYDRDSDTVSINSVMYEELCRSEIASSRPSSPVPLSNAENQEKKNPIFVELSENSTNEKALENCCRQLSLENMETDAPPAILSHEPKAIVSHEKRSLEEILNNKSIEPEEKKLKLQEKAFVVKQVNLLEEKKESVEKTATRQLPKIQKVERVNNILTKPQFNESTTMSNLFTPNHYAKSTTSTDNFSVIGDSEFDETRLPYGLDLQRDNGTTTPIGDGDLSNWMMTNMSPPMSQSSFTSDTSAVKNFSKKDDSTTDNDQSAFSVAGSSFFNLFNPGNHSAGFF